MGLYQKELELVLSTQGGIKIQAKEAVAKRLVDMAIKGDINAIKELANRIEGMPKQQTDITSQGDKISWPVPYTETKDENG